MSQYVYINANPGVTPVLPYNTPETGAPSFSYVMDNGGNSYLKGTYTAPPPIVQVVGGAPILEYKTGIINIGYGYADSLQWQAYPGTGRPVVKLQPLSGFIFGTSTGPWPSQIKGLTFMKDCSSQDASNYMLGFALRNDSYLFTVDECEFYEILYTSFTGGDSAIMNLGGYIPGIWVRDCLFRNLAHCAFRSYAANIGETSWITNCTFVNAGKWSDGTYDPSALRVSSPQSDDFRNNVYLNDATDAHAIQNVSVGGGITTDYALTDGSMTTPFSGSNVNNPTHWLQESPQYINIDATNFRLKGTSPCRGYGVVTGYNRDFYDTARDGTAYDIGATTYITQAWNTAPAKDGTARISTIYDKDRFATLASSDPYFDTDVEINKIDVFYYDSSNRQLKRVIHQGDPLTGNATWGPIARDGTWHCHQVRLQDGEGATNMLDGTLFPDFSFVI